MSKFKILNMNVKNTERTTHGMVCRYLKAGRSLIYKGKLTTSTMDSHLYIRQTIYVNIYNHGNKGLGHKFLNLITALPGIRYFQ